MKEETKRQLLKQMTEINLTMLRLEYSHKKSELMRNQAKTSGKPNAVKDMRVLA